MPEDEWARGQQPRFGFDAAEVNDSSEEARRPSDRVVAELGESDGVKRGKGGEVN
jgi:hypothetical protein